MVVSGILLLLSSPVIALALRSRAAAPVAQSAAGQSA